MELIRFVFAILFVLVFNPTFSQADSTWPPTSTKYLLSDFKAKGDGSDDTAALKAAMAVSDSYCIDGQSKTYGIVGTMRASHDACLKNMTIVQLAKPPIEISTLIRSGREPLQNLSAYDPPVFYDEDPQVSDSVLAAMNAWLNLRTIAITDDKLSGFRVTLVNVHVNKGSYYYTGDRSASSGIYVGHARRVMMKNIEVTGKGFGGGVTIVDSSNIKLIGLNIHDLTWAPYPGEIPNQESIDGKQFAWNGNPTYRFIPQARKFGRVRIQEGSSGLDLTQDTNVEIKNSTIKNVGSLFVDASGNHYVLPWQSHGIGANVNNLRIENTTVDGAGADIDLTGATGAQNFVISNVSLSNGFEYGLKIVHGSQNGMVNGITIKNCGLNGIVFNAPAKNVKILNAKVYETGVIYANGKFNFFRSANHGFPQAAINGVRLIYDGVTSPTDYVRLVDSTIANDSFPGVMQNGIIADASNHIHVIQAENSIRGYSNQAVAGFNATRISFAQVKNVYQQINNCVGNQVKMVSFWDNTVSKPDGSTPWDLAELQHQLENLKSRGIFYCQ